jgi:hypothetical protein
MSIVSVTTIKALGIGHTNGTAALKFSGTGGVLLPNQPYVLALSSTLSADRFISYSSLSVPFGSGDLINRGNHFNASTGIFTCPVDGMYLIAASYDNSTNVVERNIGHLWINNVIQGEWVESYGPYDNTSGMQLKRLNANDTIQIGVNTGLPFGFVVLQIYFLG